MLKASEMSEKEIQQRILLKLNSRRDIRVFRNNIGVAFTGKLVFEEAGRIILEFARRIAFGLIEGSGDLIGWKKVVITPDMVGKTVAVFLSCEMKTKNGRSSKEQINWAEQVTLSGGISQVMRSPKEVDKI